MWPLFFLSCIAALTILYPIGFVATSKIRLQTIEALAIAPLTTIVLLSVSSIALAFLTVPANLGTVGLLSLLLAFLIRGALSLCERKRNMDENAAQSLAYHSSETAAGSYAPIVAACLVSIAITMTVFASSVQSPDSLLQNADGVFHLGKVETYLTSSTFSFFNDPFYSSQEEATYQIGSSYYPSAWHVVCALIAQCTGHNVPLAANAENIIITAFVFPLSMGCLVFHLAKGNRWTTAIAVIASTAFVSFPWGMIIWGPLFPNALSFSMLPAFLTICIMVLEPDLESTRRAQYLILLAIGTVSLVLAQPNTLFSAILILLPYCVYRAWVLPRTFRKIKSSNLLSLASATIVVVLFVAFWSYCYQSPVFAGVVSFVWPATTSLKRGLFDALTYGMNGIPAEPLLTLLTLLGIVFLTKQRKHLWVLAAWCLAILQYVVCVSQDTMIQQLLCGFWYSDAHRIAANVVITSVVLVAFGLQGIFSYILSKSEKEVGGKHIALKKNLTIYAVVLVSMIGIYGPISLPEASPVAIDAYGALSSSIHNESDNDSYQILTNEELEFSKKALSMIPEGSLIINSPNDGSCYLYSAINANIYYRALNLPNSPDNETKEGREIRRGLDDISSDSEIQRDVEKLHAQYVLLLDQGTRDDENRLYFWSYYPDQWEGIESITDSTPGFSIVLAEKDMRLYKIDEINANE